MLTIVTKQEGQIILYCGLFIFSNTQFRNVFSLCKYHTLYANLLLKKYSTKKIYGRQH